MSYAIVRAGEQIFRPVTELAGMNGVRVAPLIDTGHGSVHLEIALVELAPGGVIPGHIHPFEESFFILSGRALFALGETSYTLNQHDFGVAPIAAPHAGVIPLTNLSGGINLLSVRLPGLRLPMPSFSRTTGMLFQVAYSRWTRKVTRGLQCGESPRRVAACLTFHPSLHRCPNLRR